jgi:cell division initiation protein
MRVTPLEIRQKTFEKNFRGYQIDEVNAFLQTMSQEWERIMDENKELRIKLEATEREVSKLREVESSLYKTLKTAEDTGANVIEQARVAADLHLRDSQLKSDALLNEAKRKAKDTIDESDMRAKDIVAEMEERLKMMVENYRKLEAHREDLLNDLKRLSNDTLDRVERARQQTKDFNPDDHLAQAKRETRKIAFPNQHTYEKIVRPEPVPVPMVVMEPVAQAEQILDNIILEHREEVLEEVVVEAPPAPIPAKKIMKSFFDEIG